MRTTIAVLALTFALAGCGSETGDGDVTGQDPTDEATSPTTAPTGPPWPEFPHDDYTFVYSRTCRCLDGGVEIEVTVVDDEPVEAAYAGPGRGVQAGDPATQEWHLITIDDVIDHANTEGAATVDVEWPAGQDYPDRVWVDPDATTVDEEMGFTIHRVDLAG